jgi:hypothetical protein
MIFGLLFFYGIFLLCPLYALIESTNENSVSKTFHVRPLLVVTAMYPIGIPLIAVAFVKQSMLDLTGMMSVAAVIVCSLYLFSFLSFSYRKSTIFTWIGFATTAVGIPLVFLDFSQVVHILRLTIEQPY